MRQTRPTFSGRMRAYITILSELESPLPYESNLQKKGRCHHEFAADCGDIERGSVCRRMLSDRRHP